MNQLHWYPHSPEEWLRMTATLNFEQRGALQHVMDQSWLYREPAGTIFDHEEEFRNLLGANWRRLAPVIRRYFVEDLAHPGLLRFAWLADKHADQSSRYKARAEAGQRGLDKQYGDNKVAKRKGQDDLFRKPSRRAPRKSAPAPIATVTSALHDAMHDALHQQTPSIAGVEVDLDSSLEPRTGAAVAVASNAPAASQVVPPAWSGPKPDQLRSWAEGDPEILSAVRDRTRVLSADIPEHVQVPSIRALREVQALQEIWDARHPREVSP